MRMIDADELKALYEGLEDDLHMSVRVVKANIDDMPTIDAVPIKHGRWIDDGDSILHCTCCHRYIRRIIPVGYDYCPHCGARMDGGENG